MREQTRVVSRDNGLEFELFYFLENAFCGLERIKRVEVVDKKKSDVI